MRPGIIEAVRNANAPMTIVSSADPEHQLDHRVLRISTPPPECLRRSIGNARVRVVASR